jgi:hypothetical protein
MSKCTIYRTSFKMAYNVKVLCAVGALKHEIFNLPLNLIKITNDEYSR